ncbi:MAG TPA: hypothetical protein VK681_00325, partial [Reyranella sp.]|nr:hypothetical protein [Reyranella sp.]
AEDEGDQRRHADLPEKGHGNDPAHPGQVHGNLAHYRLRRASEIPPILPLRSPYLCRAALNADAGYPSKM